ncbi:hypothetical protein [Streptomyces natalensis]|uniref:Uncharacterized protein n=1 Tax=Streptomyces natalensis ATCC 27448 TaxID=1240678 RepID=A0A0D7CTZ7_9ACTN|nr:hypothetical protein [Streptomyces natalensis]KIZ19541.1 hypothetical protein SNA_03280 [Streptomyces natalensis ATCC 27448]
MNFKRILGIALICAGAILAIFFWDLKYQWFKGGPLGVLLLIIGVIDLAESFRSADRKKSRGIVGELRDDLGINSRRRDDDRRQ